MVASITSKVPGSVVPVWRGIGQVVRLRLPGGGALEIHLDDVDDEGRVLLVLASSPGFAIKLDQG